MSVQVRAWGGLCDSVALGSGSVGYSKDPSDARASTVVGATPAPPEWDRGSTCGLKRQEDPVVQARALLHVPQPWTRSP